jgi:Protein of unknown function (DUF1488)
MNILRAAGSAFKPRWDGSRILFQIEISGNPIACAISRTALGQITGASCIAKGDLVRRFAEGRGRIEQIAAGIFAVRPDGATGTLNIWSDDIDDPPPGPAIARLPSQLPAGEPAPWQPEQALA